MSTPRILSPALLAAGEIPLPDEAARHVAALRLKAGAPLAVFDGTGGEWAARLAEAGKRPKAWLIEHHAVERESPLESILLQALCSGDKMDFVVQKATELGVSRIIPWQASRSELRLSGERAEKRLARWRQIAISACEQCGRNRLPEISLPASPAEAFGCAKGQKVLFSPEAEGTLGSLPASPAASLLIGPEGGLAPEEIAAAKAAGFAARRLGPRVLRTETAGLAALAVLQSLWGDWA
jgi:16S rRNA (uracil1498-N3)-methyltransferase